MILVDIRSLAIQSISYKQLFFSNAKGLFIPSKLLVSRYFLRLLQIGVEHSPRNGNTTKKMYISVFPDQRNPNNMAFVPGALSARFPLTKHLQQNRTSTISHSNRVCVYMGRRSEKIKGRKDAQTLARTKVFARVGKMITMAAKQGGPDVIANKALADAIATAKAVSFPKDTMEKAIARATSADQADYKESTFEAYGHGGTAIYIDVLTDNSNRAAADIRTAINKNKMKIASPGSVAFNFERKGVVRIAVDSVSDSDELLMTAIDAGAEECDPDENDDSLYQVITDPGSLSTTRDTLKEAGYDVEVAQLEMVPKTWVSISKDDLEHNLRGIEALEALEDVDGVYMNGKLE